MGARLSIIRRIASRIRAGVEVSKEEVSPYIKYHQEFESGDSISCWFLCPPFLKVEKLKIMTIHDSNEIMFTVTEGFQHGFNEILL